MTTDTAPPTDDLVTEEMVDAAARALSESSVPDTEILDLAIVALRAVAPLIAARAGCVCRWEGPPSDPTMIKPCHAHSEWMQNKRREAVAAEREACASFAFLWMLNEYRAAFDDAEALRDAIRARGETQ